MGMLVKIAISYICRNDVTYVANPVYFVFSTYFCQFASPMDEVAHERVLQYFKVVNGRPVQTLLNHYSHLVEHRRNQLFITQPSEELSLMRRGFLAQLRTNRGVNFGITNVTKYVVVMNSYDDRVIIHGCDIEIMIAAFGADSTMIRGLMDIEAHTDSFKDGKRRLIVGYVVSPWHVRPDEIAYQVRCTHLDGSADCEAIVSRDGTMTIDVQSSINIADLDDRLRTRMCNQFSSYQSSEKCEPVKLVPRSVLDAIVSQKQTKIGELCEQISLMSFKLDSYEETRFDIDAAVANLRKELETENADRLQRLEKHHKEDLEAACRKGALAQQEMILLLTKDHKKVVNQMQSRITTIMKEVQGVHTKKHNETRLGADKLVQLSLKHMMRVRRRDCLRAALLTYLKQEARFIQNKEESVNMKSTIFHKMSLIRKELVEKRVENAALKEMIGECDIDIFTHQQAIHAIQRANRLYVENLILDKRKRSNRYSSELKLNLQTHRELVQGWRCQARQWRETHNITSTGFFYPIKPSQLNLAPSQPQPPQPPQPSQPPQPPQPLHPLQPLQPLQSPIGYTQHSSTPVVVHYHHHTHHHTQPQCEKNLYQSYHSG